MGAPESKGRTSFALINENQNQKVFVVLENGNKGYN